VRPAAELQEVAQHGELLRRARSVSRSLPAAPEEQVFKQKAR
jgi:hypothetical protein